ncbi:Crp/Fnr family transcriptional regulator [uncultured Rhodospira sp.]|uniref:Crp/Fnr family transcriptional regulator n=1 Tax=uncultured Rhodospira sp. TaxID=1936189 RepID=UPI0026108407|nr:Crp/Fnr family transcriptional regulator [uncultured Rhodospira sp.]
MITLTDPLAPFALFEGVSENVRITLARLCTHRTFAPRQVICDVNSPDRDVMFILEGTVTVSSYSSSGREIAFAELAAGQYFGEIAAIDGRHRSAAVTGRTKGSLLVMSGDQFGLMLRQHPDIAWRVMVRLTDLIRRTNDRLQSFSTQSVTQRVSQELLNLCKPSQAVPGTFIIYPTPTQAELGTRIGASRETVARVLLDLAQDGIVIRKGRTLNIPDRERLTALVEGLRGGLQTKVA